MDGAVPATFHSLDENHINSDRQLSSVSSILRRLKRPTCSDVVELPTCKDYLEGFATQTSKSPIDVSVKIGPKLVDVESDQHAKSLHLSDSILDGFSEDVSTGTLRLSSSILEDFVDNYSTGTLVLDEDVHSISSTGSSSPKYMEAVTGSSTVAVIKD